MGTVSWKNRRANAFEVLVWINLGSLLLCAKPTAAQPQGCAHQQQPDGSTLGVQTIPGKDAVAAQQLTAQEPTAEPMPQSAPQPNPQALGSISGKVVDQTGVSISAAKVALAREDKSIHREVLTDDDGRFSFTDLPPGPFHLTISSPDLTPQTFDDTLQPGQAYAFPLVMLTIATQVTEVRVGITPEEEATMEVHDEEKQRVLGFIPNFYVSYVPNPAPLTRKLKFHLAWKSSTDPFTLGGVGVLAGIEQATNKWKEYGQGAQGYAKRYGASYADVAAGTFIGNAVLPSLFKQDPRYFYKGTGSKRSRILHALLGTFEARSDSGKWEPNYSNVLGSAAAGGISNLYYPANRRGVGLVFSTMLVRLCEITAANFFEEFLGTKVTSNVPARATGQP